MEEAASERSRVMSCSAMMWVHVLVAETVAHTHLLYFPKGVDLPRCPTRHPYGIDVFGRPLVHGAAYGHIFVAGHTFHSGRVRRLDKKAGRL